MNKWAFFSSTSSRLNKNSVRPSFHFLNKPSKSPFKKGRLGLAVLCLLLTGNGLAFTDIPATDPNYSIFTHLDEVNIMHDRSGAFLPDTNVTRAEALTVALRAGGISIPLDFDGTTNYADVDPNMWYAPAVARAVEIKVLKARTGNFRPNQVVSKAEFLTLLFRATQVDLRPFYGSRNIAQDIPNDSWMMPFFAYAKRYQIAHLPADGYYLPQKTLTRREVALMTYRQLRVFHGSDETKLLVELKGSINQFLELIRHGKTAEAEFEVYNIMQINDKILRTRNSEDAVATLAISRSMEHLSDSLRQFKYGKNLKGISELHLALKQAERAEAKSPAMAPFAKELTQIISESLMAYTQPSLGTFTAK